MADITQELKTKEYSFNEFRDRFNEFWSTFQNVIGMESTRFLGNIIQIDPGKKSKTALHFNLLNCSFVLSYYLVSYGNEYRCMLLVERIMPGEQREYVSHCYFDMKGNIYLKLEDKSSQHNLNEERFIVNLVNDISNKIISSKTTEARGLEGKGQG